MTVVEPIRRSKRIQEIKSSQQVVVDEDIEGDEYQDEDGEYYEEEEEKKGFVEEEAERYIQFTDGYKELREKFEEHYMFQALVDADASVAELANEWVDQYKNDKDLAKKDLVNMMLNAVGCFTKIEEHDVANNESASETVGEIQTFFKRQKVHEFYLLSKKPEYKHLLKNFQHFISNLIQTADESGVLYSNIVIAEEDEDVEEPDDTNLMEDLLIWLSSFSVSTIRSLRYISTLALFTIETTLCKTAKKNNTSLEDLKHQLLVEKGKKQTATIKKRVSQIEENVETYTNQSILLENFIQDIVNTSFIHRFKDVDHHIRIEAMNSLGEWMILYPELFYKVTYLKYLGWILSDSNSSVRIQVLKTLVKLLKHNSIVAGLRQFVERFKGRIVEMAFYDVDNNVKNNAIILLTEINKIGYLEEESIHKITSLLFTSEDSKTKSLVATFVSQVETDRTSDIIETYEITIEQDQDKFTHDLRKLIKYNALLKLLEESYQREDQPEGNPFIVLADIIVSTKRYTNPWSDLIEYYTLDISSCDKLSETMRDILKLDLAKRVILLSLLNGSLAKLLKSKGSDEDCVDVSSKLEDILKIAEQSEEEFGVFLQIFGLFNPQFLENLNKSQVYKSIFQAIAKHFNLVCVIDTKSVFKDLTNELILGCHKLVQADDFIISQTTAAQIEDDFISKLLVLGTSFDISDALPYFAELKDKLFSVLPDMGLAESSSLQQMVISLSKVILSSVSWKLNNLLQSNEMYDIEEELKPLPGILFDECELITERSSPLTFRTDLSFLVIDLYVLLKNFFENYIQSGKDNLSHTSRFKDLELESLKPRDTTIASLKDIFLIKESKYASLLGEVLEREDDEGIDYNSVEATDDAVAWELERDLALFTLKIVRFSNMGFLPNDFISRLSLNRSILGELFATVIEEQSNTPQAEPELEEVHDEVPSIHLD
ncbi:Cohesin subunit SCC3 AltName: Full=Irregular cell behavior protein 1 [Cyberlindnera jadinii]|uniref:SCD domain-containing protein n=1 Tax=Cyberlindnera jadinii (strain ATCC 18201 / CBS 1600 / BCRC 20928 / JCM 3617 / NBRC 0987 / NRRL Y-1542) TaxID=983966 RepID=A0A0H5CKS4_CYBJN|nr:Cohesin subunit SCC3 AltName: Full=Irregular cell behavior protein 1 [Cyberlindnera jadinii]